MIRLHHARGSRSMRVKWLLEELGTAYEIELVNFAEMSKPDYLRIHPLSAIPALQDGDLTLFESGAIVEYILENYGGEALMPQSGQERALCRQWMHYAEATLMPPLSDIAQHSFILRQEERIEAVVPNARARVAKQLGVLDGILADRDYICGSEFSAADIMLGYALGLSKSFGAIGDDTPNVSAYMERLETRQAYQKARA